MPNGPSREEMQRLYDTIDDGFKGVHARLDVLNGRTLKGEIADAEVRAKVVSLEKTVFPRRAASGSGESWAGAMTAREKALVGLGFVVLSIALKILEIVGTKFWDVLAHAR